jgi:hypothetical protein
MPKILTALIVGAMVFLLACKESESRFRLVRVDREVSGPSSYPLAVDVGRVGTYPPDTKSGAGYFYDDVLEYRVWMHPEKGAERLNGDNDYFVAFAQFERAEAFSKATPGAEEPLVLVRQLEWVDEPEPGHYIPENGLRVTEWQVEWLAADKRSPGSIQEFMKHPRPVKEQ